MNSEFIKRLTNIVEANLSDENFGVEDLVREMGISHITLHRKLKTISNQTISQFIREIRLKKSKELLLNEDLTVSEIAYRVGFGSPTYFNKCFHEFFGYPPGVVIHSRLERTEPEIVEPIAVTMEQPGSGRKSYSQFLAGALIFVLIMGVIVFVLHKNIHIFEWSKDQEPSSSKISIAVMPFYNLTNDTTWNIWEEGLQQCLISSLSNNKILKVRQKESINALLYTGGITKHVALTLGIEKAISKKLDVNFFITGSIKQAGTVLRIDAQLTNAQTNEIIQTFVTEKPSEEEYIFQIIDTISTSLKNYLLISELLKENPEYQHYPAPSTKSAEAFRYNIYGNQAAKRFENDRAISWYLKALEADSNYFSPMMGLSTVYARKGNMEKNCQWVIRYYKKKDRFPFEDQLWASWAYAFSFEPPENSINYLKQLQQMDDQSPQTYYLIGITYNIMKQYNKAIPELEKNLEICQRWGTDFMKNNSAYAELGTAYHKTGQYKKEKKIYKLAEKYIPDDPLNLCRRAILALSEKDTTASNRYFKKYIVVHRQKFPNWEAEIPASQGWIYSEAGYPDRAEEYFRKSISMDPDNPFRLYTLANFLIDNDRKLEDIQGLMDHAMALAANKTEYYNYMDTKGWGLYKLGKYKEALEILQKTWDSAPVHLYSLYSHLEAVKKVFGNNQAK